MGSLEEFVNQENTKPRRSWLFKAGNIVAWFLLALFAIGITGVDVLAGQFAFLQNNWLIVLFKLNVQFYNAQRNMLNVFNVLDLTIMVLFCILFLALNVALYRSHKTWSAIATSLPFLGIVLFVITHTAGRSGLLIGVLIFSIVMLGSNDFDKICAYLGIAASALLFIAGDIGTTFFPSSVVIAALIGIGYILWIIWLALIGWKFFQLHRC